MSGPPPTDESKRIGPYPISRELGRGGMGIVYLAWDEQLQRSVAIKVIPDSLAQDPERLARFEREARILAALSHPNIAIIHGLGEDHGHRFLVLEFVDGETLAQKLARGPLPIDEAIEVARQVALALEAAHEGGIVHRDLKPANVKITPGGAVKVLDFGLARGEAGAEAKDSDLSHSPTLTHTLSSAGVILGTAAYMSPEQARGKRVDRRTDIWSFGCVLYECLTGKPLFTGETVSDIVAKILEREPDWAALPARTPQALQALLRRCLEKDSKKRLRDIGDARLELDDLLAAGVSSTGALRRETGPTAGGARRGTTEGIAWGVALVSLATSLALVLPSFFRRAPEPVVTRTTIVGPPGLQLLGRPGDVAISPDGTMIAFAAADSSGQIELWLRPVESLAARPIPGTEQTESATTLPFWSPDSRRIAYFSDGKLRTVSPSGGEAHTLCDASNGRGGTWNRAGDILFAPGAQSPLFRISPSGGEPTPVTSLDSTRGETGHRFPQFLPDGRHYLFVSLTPEEGKVVTWVGELGTTRRSPLLRAQTRAMFVAPGYVVYARDQSLVAQRLDLRRMRVTGEPTPIGEAPEDLYTMGTNVVSASENGTLVYPTSAPAPTRLTWTGRDGKPAGTLQVPEGDYRQIAIGPDGRRVALARRSASGGVDIWIADAARGGATPLTTDGGDNFGLVWSPDGRRIAYTAGREGIHNFYERSVDGAGEEHPLFETREQFKTLTDLTRDGKYLVYQKLERDTKQDIWALPLTGEKKPFPVLRTPFNEGSATVSPDGRWMLYVSDDSGPFEVYVQSFPRGGNKIRISTRGGNSAGWRSDGKEILYGAPEGVMSVAVRAGETFEAGEPKLLLRLPDDAKGLGVSPDFQHFLIGAPAGETPRPSFTLLMNWTSLLGR